MDSTQLLAKVKEALEPTHPLTQLAAQDIGRIGQHYTMHGDHYILAQVEGGVFNFIKLDDGNRYDTAERGVFIANPAHYAYLPRLFGTHKPVPIAPFKD